MKQMFLLVVMVACLEANTVKDNHTGLEWQDNSDAKTIKRDWQGAKEYCQELTLAGFSDWRLPTIKELQSIVDIKRYKPAIKKTFKYVTTSAYPYWSSSEDVSAINYAWRVSFYTGSINHASKSNEYFVRCVRGRQ